MTLPDLAYGGYKAIREFQEIRELGTVARTTARSAEGLAARTASAARAERFARIAERANLRANSSSQKLMRQIGMEFTPRGAGTVGVGLLLREEITEDKSALHQITQRLSIHCTGTYR